MILKAGPAPFWFFDPSSQEIGIEYHAQYADAKPFPHIILDDFLPEDLAEVCVTQFPQRPESYTGYARSQENRKFEFKPEILSPSLRTLFYSFNSIPFIGFLERFTGIKGLISDPYFSGAGLHEVATGGHLNIHADFNHQAQMDLDRRINVLIYLNSQLEGRIWRLLRALGPPHEPMQIASSAAVQSVRYIQYFGDFISRQPRSGQEPEGALRGSRLRSTTTLPRGTDHAWNGQRNSKCGRIRPTNSISGSGSKRLRTRLLRQSR